MTPRHTWRIIGVIVAIFFANPVISEDNEWRISKVSGEAWVSRSGADQASLTRQADLQPGDEIRTGRNGRVLLIRGAETMLVSPNSAINLPEQGRAGMTTVIQRAGTVLLDVEKRNVQHFEVETPFLAAVVKGTRFRVSVTQGQAKVDVVRGQVQVADFRSGQFAMVLPGQNGRASVTGAPGLRLGGQGTPGQILQGPAQASRVAPLLVPRSGLTAPSGARPIGSAAGAAPASIGGGVDQAGASTKATVVKTAGGGVRITAPIGEVKLDIGKLTNGMARSEAPGVTGASRRETIWAPAGSASSQLASSQPTAANGSSTVVNTGPQSTSLGTFAAVQPQAASDNSDTASDGSNVAIRGGPNAVPRRQLMTVPSNGKNDDAGPAAPKNDKNDKGAGSKSGKDDNAADPKGVKDDKVPKGPEDAKDDKGGPKDDKGNSGKGGARPTAASLVNQLLGQFGHGPGGGNGGIGNGNGKGNGKH